MSTRITSWLVAAALLGGAMIGATPASASAIVKAASPTESAPEASPAAAPAPVAAPPAAPTIATVDLEQVVNGLKEREDREKSLKAAIEDYQKRIDAMAEEYKSIGTKYDNEPAGPGKTALRKEGQEKAFRIKSEKAFAEGIISEMRGEVFRDLFAKITDAVQKIAKQNNYQLVLVSDEKVTITTSDPESVMRAISMRRVLYADPELDITKSVVQYMNNEYAAGASAAPTPPPPAPTTTKPPAKPATTAPKKP